MNPRLVVFSAAVTLAAGAASAFAAGPAKYDRPGHTERVSVSSSGAQAAYPAASPVSAASDLRSAVSANGRVVVFESDATNLVPGATNSAGTNQIYWHDTRTGATKLVSVALNGAPALGASAGPVVSADGRYVAFQSAAANLVPGDTNLRQDVFRRDMVTGLTVRVSVATSGQQAMGASPTAGMGGSSGASISADGRRVAFQSEAANLAPGTEKTPNVFVRDLRQRTTVLVSVGRDGAPAGSVRDAGISGNGRYVVFTGRSGLVSQQTFNNYEVYVRDLAAAKTALASVNSGGEAAQRSPGVYCGGAPSGISVPEPLASLVQQDAGSVCVDSDTFGTGYQSISDDGRSVTFISNATNLVPNFTCASPTTPVYCFATFVHDFRTGRTERVDVDPVGQPQQLDLQLPDGRVISSDGRFVAYHARRAAPNERACSVLPVADPVLSIVAPGAISCSSEALLLYDRFTGQVDSLTQSTAGKAPQAGRCGPTDLSTSSQADLGGISADGRYVSFNSSAINLVAGDTNDRCDVFLRDRGPALGVGGLTGTQPPSSPPPGCGLPVCPPLVVGAGLHQVRVVPRQALQDLSIRWDLTQMTPVSGAPAGGLLYELRFTSGGQHYAVRAQRLLGPDYDVAGGASFGLFREAAPGVWTHVAALKGGYGTIGDSVVTAVPLSLLDGKAQLTDVTAYSAVGSYLSGPTKVLDSLRLAR